MWFVYFDESKQDNKVFVYSALIVDGEQWNSAFESLKNLRRDLRSKHGVFIAKNCTHGNSQPAKAKSRIDLS